jgi:acyl-CoA thioesterase
MSAAVTQEWFDDHLAPRRDADSDFTLAIPEGWEQGRAVFGGLVLGGMVRAMAAVLAAPERRLRSLSAELIASPSPGETQVHVRLLRAGNSVTTLSAELSQNNALLAHATGIFGHARPVTEQFQILQPPAAPKWQDVQALDMNVPFAPKFTQHFEYRPLQAFPFSGDVSGQTIGYIRPRSPVHAFDEAVVTAMADAWWLATMVRLSAPRPAATLSFSLDLHHPAQAVGDEPLLHRGSLLAMGEGYASELRELWTTDGNLVSVNRQLVAIIK